MARGERDGGAGARREARLRAALQGFADGDLAGAEAALAGIVREDSDDAQAYLALARTYRARGEVGRALRIHQNLALRRDLPRELDLRVRLGLAGDLRAGGYRERAIAAYREVLAHDPRNGEALAALVALCEEAGDPAAALGAVRKARGWLGRGDAALETRLVIAQARAAHEAGRSREARGLARRAAKLAPHDPAPRVLLGDLEAERGRGGAALAAWSAAVGLAGAGDDALWERIRSAHAAKGGRGSDAGEAFVRTHLAAHPDDRAAARALARVLAGRGAVDEALRVLREALARAPGDARTRAQLGRLLRDERRDAEALAVFDEWIARAAGGPDRERRAADDDDGRARSVDEEASG